MVSESSGECVHPVLLTAYPCTSSHGRSNSICAERPTPSVPSIAIKCPGSRFFVTYGRPCPYQALSWLRCGAIFSVSSLEIVVAKYFLDHRAHDLLLIGDLGSRVNRTHPELSRQLIVNFEYAALEHAETLDRIGREPDVHAGLVVLELGAAQQQALERDSDRHAKGEGQIGPHRGAVHRGDPRGSDVSPNGAPTACVK